MICAASMMIWGMCFGSAPQAQESDAQRLRQLEEQVRQQRLELDALKQSKPAPVAGKPDPDEAPFEAYWKDGLRFRSHDRNFEAHVGGRALFHYRFVHDRPDDDAAPLRSVPDAFLARQIRLELDGIVYKEFGFKVQTEFSSGNLNQSSGASPSNVTGSLRDAWVEWRRWKEMYVRIGQFYEPISQEDFTSTRFINFAERSPMNRLLPGRELGLEIYGTAFEERLTYFLMLSNGGALLNDQGRAVTDRNDEKELAAVVWTRPFAGTDMDLFRGLRVGFGGSIGNVDEVDGANFDLISTELSILYLDAPAAAPDFDGRRIRLVPQVMWPIGPLSLSGEYLWREDELVAGSPENRLKSRGWYAAATILLTGEDKKPEQRVAPLGEWGAVELAVRVAQVEIRNAFTSGMSTVGGNSDKITTVTVGVNWWLRRNLRLTLNVIREEYEDRLSFDTRTEDMLWGMLFRAQIDF